MKERTFLHLSSLFLKEMLDRKVSKMRDGFWIFTAKLRENIDKLALSKILVFCQISHQKHAFMFLAKFNQKYTHAGKSI